MSTRLRVGNLPPHVTASDLKTRFSRYGAVSFAALLDDQAGSAAVEMTDPDGAAQAIQWLNFSSLEGQVITVSYF